jgi:hypothetical protein
MNIFSNIGILGILGKAFQHVVFKKDESFFQLLFGLPQVLAITQGVEGVDDVHNVAQEASIQSSFL